MSGHSDIASVEDDTKRVQNALCTRMRIVFSSIRLGPKTSMYEMNVTVVSTVTGCDVTYCATTLQGFNKHASSRREAVSDSRGVPRCTEKNFKNLRTLTSVDRSGRPIHHTRIQRIVLTMEVTRRHCTICQVNSSRSAQYPCQALISICGISRVPVLSFQCHLDSHRS